MFQVLFIKLLLPIWWLKCSVVITFYFINGFGNKRSVMAVEFMLSEKGKTLLLLDGFKFSKAHTSQNGRIRWKCTNKNCSSKLYTMQSEETKLVQSEVNHNKDTTRYCQASYKQFG